jgi:putative membrane protein
MIAICRRTVLTFIGAAPLAYATQAAAVDALPDARFVGFSQAVNDFEVQSGQLALARSTNENVRGYASRAIAEHTTAAQALSKSRQEAGVSYAPDGTMGPRTSSELARLNSLQGAQFDQAFASAQLAVQTAAVDQFGAYSQNGTSGPLRRYAQQMLPKSKMFLEYAQRLAGGR